MNDFERQIINSIKYIENNETTFYNDEDFTKEDYLRNAMIYCSDDVIFPLLRTLKSRVFI